MKHRAVESVQTLTTPLISSHSLTIEVLCKLWSNKQNKSKVVNVDTHIHTHTHTHTNTHTNTHTHIHTHTALTPLQRQVLQETVWRAWQMTSWLPVPECVMHGLGSTRPCGHMGSGDAVTWDQVMGTWESGDGLMGSSDGHMGIR